MSFPMCGKHFFTVERLGTDFTGKSDGEMLSLNVSVDMGSFLIAVATVRTLPQFVTPFVLALDHLALYALIICWKEKFRSQHGLFCCVAEACSGS